MAPLLDAAGLPRPLRGAIRETATRLVTALRAKQKGGGVEGLVQEYSLSSQEGVALMCLAEALLRIPDDDTRDALIRDKIGDGDWRAHLGHSPSLFVNAATWGLMLTGRLTATSSERSLSAALTRLIGRGGEPLIRGGVNLAMRLMGEQFVAGQTIERHVCLVAVLVPGANTDVADVSVVGDLVLQTGPSGFDDWHVGVGVEHATADAGHQAVAEQQDDARADGRVAQVEDAQRAEVRGAQQRLDPARRQALPRQ